MGTVLSYALEVLYITYTQSQGAKQLNKVIYFGSVIYNIHPKPWSEATSPGHILWELYITYTQSQSLKQLNKVIYFGIVTYKKHPKPSCQAAKVVCCVCVICNVLHPKTSCEAAEVIHLVNNEYTDKIHNNI